MPRHDLSERSGHPCDEEYVTECVIEVENQTIKEIRDKHGESCIEKNTQ